MKSYNAQEFMPIWHYSSDFIRLNCNIGRGIKSSHKANDVFFMTLCVIKHGNQWDFMERILNMKWPTFERMITCFSKTISNTSFCSWIQSRHERYLISRMIEGKRVFLNHPYCRYPVDVTFQQSNRPSGNLEDVKAFFLGKQKLYGYKTEVSVMENGQAIRVSK